MLPCAKQWLHFKIFVPLLRRFLVRDGYIFPHPYCKVLPRSDMAQTTQFVRLYHYF